jgi:hypothetical protein
VYFLFNSNLRDSGLPADVLLGKFKKDGPYNSNDTLLQRLG